MQLKYISEGTLMWPLWGLKTLWLIFMKVSINLCNFEIAFMHILITSISIVDTGMVLWSIKHSIIDMTSSDNHLLMVGFVYLLCCLWLFACSGYQMKEITSSLSDLFGSRGWGTSDGRGRQAEGLVERSISREVQARHVSDVWQSLEQKVNCLETEAIFICRRNQDSGAY